MMQTTHTGSMPAPNAASQAAGRKASVILQAVAAIGLGLFVLGMVGFSQVDVFHNAAHDVRHSNAFPCH